MALKQQLHQKQVQKLILAPALQQAIKLLPLTNLELIEIIDEQLSENPMLEVEEETMDSSTESEKQSESDEKEAKEEEPAEPLTKEAEEDSSSTDDSEEIESYFQEYFDDGFRPSYSQEVKEAPPLENLVSKSASLWDHLNWQADLTFYDDREKEIAQFIIGNIDEDGYLTATVAEIASAMEATVEEVEGIRDVIKKFDPVGVACVSLKETLLIHF